MRRTASATTEPKRHLCSSFSTRDNNGKPTFILETALLDSALSTELRAFFLLKIASHRQLGEVKRAPLFYRALGHQSSEQNAKMRNSFVAVSAQSDDSTRANRKALRAQTNKFLILHECSLENAAVRAPSENERDVAARQISSTSASFRHATPNFSCKSGGQFSIVQARLEIIQRFGQPLFQLDLRLPTQNFARLGDVGFALFGIVLRQRLEDDLRFRAG